MRISDWSSDVCSSDLFGIEVDGERLFEVDGDLRAGLDIDGRERLPVQLVHPVRHVAHATGQDAAHGLVARDADAADGTVGADVGQDRKTVGWGKSGSVRVDHGGARTLKKKKYAIVRVSS